MDTGDFAMHDSLGTHIQSVAREVADLLHALPVDEMNALAERVAKAKRVFSAGAGRSGLMARAFAMRLLHLGKESFVVGDTGTPAIGERDALLIVSGSGSTAGLALVADKAKRLGAAVCVVSGCVDSPLVHIAGSALIIPPPVSGKPVQPMGSRFEQGALLALDIIVMDLMERLGRTESDMVARHANLE